MAPAMYPCTPWYQCERVELAKRQRQRQRGKIGLLSNWNAVHIFSLNQSPILSLDCCTREKRERERERERKKKRQGKASEKKQISTQDAYVSAFTLIPPVATCPSSCRINTFGHRCGSNRYTKYTPSKQQAHESMSP